MKPVVSLQPKGLLYFKDPDGQVQRLVGRVLEITIEAPRADQYADGNGPVPIVRETPEISITCTVPAGVFNNFIWNVRLAQPRARHLLRRSKKKRVRAKYLHRMLRDYRENIKEGKT